MSENLKTTTISEVRKYLHQHPELSNQEMETAKYIAGFFRGIQGFTITENVGGHGVIASLDMGEGPHVMFRAELDALPVQELNSFPHKSTKAMTSHKCGHDGHMAILLGLAESLANRPTDFDGRISFLFQPAEETGEGAARVLNHPEWQQNQPDFIFALHNLPGYPINSILCRPGIFASASVGVRILLKGKTSHAAHPENAINPIISGVEIYQKIMKLPEQLFGFEDGLVTPISFQSGEESFGTSPANGSLLFTFRAAKTQNLDRMTGQLEEILKDALEKYGISYDVKFTEYFAATTNSPELYSQIKASAEEQGLLYIEQEKPFRWSEDFGRFTEKYAGAMFGLGSGENCPQLHNPDYDFPDEIIETGVKMFRGILSKLPAI